MIPETRRTEPEILKGMFAGLLSLSSMICLLAILASGCTKGVDVEGSACDGAHSCPEGYKCALGTCYQGEQMGVACLEDGDCPAGVCLEQAHVCVGCLKHSDCISRLCEIQSHICLGCKADYQCPSNSCDEETGICEESSTKDDGGSNL